MNRPVRANRALRQSSRSGRLCLIAPTLCRKLTGAVSRSTVSRDVANSNR
jgi:hypothetical protein